LPVGATLFVHPTAFLTPYLPYPAVVPSFGCSNFFFFFYGAPDLGLPSPGALTVDFWNEFWFWEAVLSSPIVPYGGITQEFARFYNLS
jgi:hypothetical protein